MINKSEIERIIDDFETKAKQHHEEAEKYYRQNDFNTAVLHDRQAHPYEYCAAVLRQVM